MKTTIIRRIEALRRETPQIPVYRVKLTNGRTETLRGWELLGPALDGQIESITCAAGDRDLAMLAKLLSPKG